MKNKPSPELQGAIALIGASFGAAASGRKEGETPPSHQEMANGLRMIMDIKRPLPVTKVVVTETEVVGRPCEWIALPDADPDVRILMIHGGFFMAGGLDSHRNFSVRLAEETGATVLAIDYRLAPEHPFPQGLDDCVAAMAWLAENGPNGPASASSLIIGGDSAGGNLTLAAMLRVRDEGKRLPDCAFVISPGADMSQTSEDWKAYVDSDILLGHFARPGLTVSVTPEQAYEASGYLQGADGRTPYASPVLADLTGLPPIYCLVSELEILLPDALKLKTKALQAGVPYRLEVWPHVFHAWTGMAEAAPESREAIRRIGNFVKTELYKKLARDRFTEGKDLSHVMAENAAQNPDVPVVVLADRSVTWADFDKRLNKVANALIALGVQPGDKVAALSSTSIEYMELMFGTLRAGACIVPLSSMAASSSLAMMINDSDSKVFFLSDAYKSLIEPVEDQLTGLVAGGKIALDFEADGWRDYGDVVDPCSVEDPGVEIDPASGFNIIYSSGTTGVPKGILHARKTRAQEYPAGAATGFSPHCVTLVSTPLYSNTTMASLLPTMAHGGTVVLMSKFDAKTFLQLANDHQVTHAMLVPVQYRRIMDVEDFDRYDLSTFEMKYSTSAPLREDLKREILDRWPGGLLEYYGMTEGGVTCIMIAHLFPDKLHTVGFPVPGCEIKIMDDQGNELPQGDVGEVVGRSLAMMDGYYKADDKTSESSYYDADGSRWHRSGDMGRFDEDGFLELLDRKKDMIISGGFNVFAADLEAVLIKHDQVEDAAVIGIPSKEWGETPLAFVVASGSNEESIRQWANERLGKGQRISAIEFREDLPRSSIGKVLKKDLRAPYWKGVGKAVN